MRFLAAAIALCFASAALADRLILIPLGKKLLSNTFRYEVLTEPSRDNTQGWIGGGFGHSFDFEITGESFNDNRMTNSLDLAYNYTVPIVDFAPGVSFGFQDALGVTERGRNMYVAITYRFGNSGELNQDIPTEFTFGFWSRREGAVFAGARLPFSHTLSLIAEHDSENITGGFEISPHETASFRFLFRQSQVIVGLRVQARF